MHEFKFYGTVSHGTMRSQDLIPRFLEVLEQLDPNGHAGYLDGLEADNYNLDVLLNLDDDHEFWDSGAAWEICYELFGLLEQHAPDDYYFGSHIGNGSDYGFWPIADDMA